MQKDDEDNAVQDHLKWTEEAGFDLFEFTLGCDDDCEICKPYEDKRFKRENLPKFPLHDGCECFPMALPNEDDD
jgi:hypothetical protein